MLLLCTPLTPSYSHAPDLPSSSLHALFFSRTSSSSPTLLLLLLSHSPPPLTLSSSHTLLLPHPPRYPSTPSSLAQFVPAYKATRIIGEVVIESLPQCILQSFIYVVVIRNCGEQAAADAVAVRPNARAP